MVWWIMCCTGGGPGPALPPVAGRRTVLELDMAAAATAPAWYAIKQSKLHYESQMWVGCIFAFPRTRIGISWHTDFIRIFLPRGKWDVNVWGGTAGALIWPLMMWMLAGIRWCKLLEWPWNGIKSEKVHNSHNSIHRKGKQRQTALTCCPLIVATGMVGVVGIVLSIVIVMWLATLGIWAWLEAGAGAMRRLGIGDFRTA